MNKISKKIVALATMAAFVLTLVPAAAFAAGAADYSASGVQVAADNSAETTVAAGDQIKVALRVQDKNDDGTELLLQNGESVVLYATEADDTDTLTNAVDFATDNDSVLEETLNNELVYKFTTTPKNNDEVYATFNRAGDYVIYAAVASSSVAGNDVATALPNAQKMGKAITVHVTDPDITANYITLDNGIGTLTAENPQGTLNMLDKDFTFNGTDEYTITGTAYEKDKTPARGVSLNVTSSKDGILDIKGTGTVTTRNDGTFSITFTMSETQNGYIYLQNDDVDFAIRVVGQKSTATDIKTVKDGGYVMAGSDDHWNDLESNRVFSNAVQFEITDAKGDVLTGDDVIAQEPAASEGGVAYKAKYINIIGKADKSTLDASDLKLVWDNATNSYTLKYFKGTEEAKKDLVPGEYTVRIALDSDNYAEATFTVAEYGKTQEVSLDLQAADIDDNGNVTSDWYSISNEVTLGQKVQATAVYVDENGLKIPATNVQFGFKGDNKLFGAINAKDGRFNTVADNLTNEALLGSVITVQVFDASQKTLIEKDLTLVDSYSEYGLAFDPTEGEVNKDNVVTVSVVDEDGNVARVTGALNAFVADQSNKDAKVSLDCSTAKDAVKNGKGTLTIYADKETTVDIVVAVDTVDGPIYAGTLEYTVGAEDLYANRSVVMTIGSTEYVVNNNIISGDAAPYVDNAWRTMVPVRALAESFGATVDYKDNVITIVDGDTEVVMNIGEETYTLNDVEKTMDTAPVIGEGDRAYVPIRFAAEALGYTVTPLYGNDGLTASVVFKR